jgi:hypothetical protein
VAHKAQIAFYQKRAGIFVSPRKTLKCFLLLFLFQRFGKAGGVAYMQNKVKKICA